MGDDADILNADVHEELEFKGTVLIVLLLYGSKRGIDRSADVKEYLLVGFSSYLMIGHQYEVLLWSARLIKRLIE